MSRPNGWAIPGKTVVRWAEQVQRAVPPEVARHIASAVGFDADGTLTGRPSALRVNFAPEGAGMFGITHSVVIPWELWGTDAGVALVVAACPHYPRKREESEDEILHRMKMDYFTG